MREIEIKLRVDDLKEIENKLKERGCVLSEKIEQYDVIYSSRKKNNESESSKEGDVTIRIRRQKELALLTLKQQRTYEMDNIELETEVKKPEEMNRILQTLGWNPVIEVKKERRKGKLGEYEICLDEVEKLGSFVELEKITDENTDPETIREELLKELESLGLSRKNEEKRGYDTQMYFLELNNQT